ncbi:MAG: Ppx/GppA phosphatase family protein [Fusobacteriaceae bacterium]
MKRIGIIDVGSNSLRLVIYEISQNKAFFPIEDIKETVRLGEGVNITGELKDSKIKLAFETIALFSEICKRNNVDEIVAFGTAAMRIATNAEILAKKVQKELGIEIEILKGEEEANFSFNGAINSLDIQDGVVIDLGGSSLEVVVFKDREPLEKISLSFGAVTLSEIGDLKNELSKKDESRIREYIRDELEKVSWLKELKQISLIGVGGTVRNIGSIHLKKKNYPLEIIHNYKLDLGGVTEVVNLVKTKDYKKKIEIPGLAKARADVFVGAAIIVQELLEYCKIQELIISGYGIREGILYKKLNEYGKVTEDVFVDSLKDVLKHHNTDLEVKEEIYKKFKKIYSYFSLKYSIKGISEKIIKIAAYMEDVGKIINYTNYDLHSFYIVLNSGIKGVEQKELLIAALIVTKGRKKEEFIEKYKRIISKEEFEMIMMLSKILNLSIILNDVLLIEEENFRMEIEENEIIFYLKKKTKLDISMVEMYISEKRFINSFDKKLKFIIEK